MPFRGGAIPSEPLIDIEKQKKQDTKKGKVKQKICLCCKRKRARKEDVLYNTDLAMQIFLTAANLLAILCFHPIF